ncbi:MAG: aminoglycoside phosphotransferase family protein [Clostridia bacterium]|nr:aminoglycoside phosphotransferase family protein [Clostridia bacterium]
MIYNDIKHIVTNFRFEGTYESACELTAGNINVSYKLTYRLPNGSRAQYVLQKINTVAFKDPVELMKNIQLVIDHLTAAQAREGKDVSRRILRFIPTVSGSYLYRDSHGDYWRADYFISDATAYDIITDPNQLYEAGRGFGEFQRYLFDFPADKLIETIPDFHNTTKRFYAFVAAVAEDRAGRAAGLTKEIDFFFDRRKMMDSIVSMTKNGEIPLRVTHNDTKLNNVLIDNETQKAICVIDLDTVMPGSILYDYGDAVRYGASTAAEDESDVSKIDVNMELFRLFTEGFVGEIRSTITENEIINLPLGIKVITCELAMRFLTDYLNGDEYFKIRYPDHNLVRARAQMALLEKIESRFDEMTAFVKTLL